MSKYFLISFEKEYKDSEKLIEIIKKDGWFTSDTVIVNCFPDYSSRLSHLLNHKLSHLNRNELFEIIELAIPYPNTNQVWNGIRKEYQNFDTYLKNWVQENIFGAKFLFLSTDHLDGRNFNKIKLAVRPHLDNEYFRFASLYCQTSSLLQPDYCVEEFDPSTQGPLLFQWENMDNPNW